MKQVIIGKLPKRINGANFKWEVRDPKRMWVLLYQDEMLARLTKNNDSSKYYTASVSRGPTSPSFTAKTLAAAKSKATAFARKEFPGFREYKQSQPTVSYLNSILSAAVKAKYGKAVRIEPTAFGTDKYKIYFENGHTQESKIPKQRNGAKPATRAAIAARVKANAKNPRDVYALYALLKRIKPGLSLRSLSQSELSEVYPLTVSGGQGLVKTQNNKLVLSQKGIIAYKALHKSLGYKTKNSTASDFRKYQSNKLAELGKAFQGEHNGQKHRLLQSDFTPNDKYRLGHLVQIKIKANGYTVPLNFDGDSMLSADLRNNLHIVGKDARINPTNLRQYGIKPPTKGNMTYLGKLVQFDYVTAKKHIENGVMTRYFHKPGEVTKELPNVFVDHDGFPHIVGGGYDVWDVGVVN